LRVLDNPLTAFNLRVFCTLMEERNVTNAATRLQLSQPATSLVLKQLREIFGDPLLIRSDGRMVPTERALMLQHGAARALADLNALIAHPGAIDLESLCQTFTLALGATLSPAVLTAFAGEVTKLAPAVRLVMRRARSGNDAAGLLASGVADVAIGCWSDPPAYLHRSMLFEEEFVCLVDRGHAFTQTAPTFADYVDARHVVVHECAEDGAEALEVRGASLQIARERKVVASDHLVVPHLLIGTDLVATVTRSFARHFVRTLPLAMLPCPVPYPRAHFYQLWDGRCEYSPAHKWLREVLASASRQSQDA
jgi:DNA-binding transcriptional LysR family regulator